MISDNYVTGDNIFLRELQNFFFEVLGMMSITHYGAVGDGRTDNYGPLQVAIDDANRRGLSYIYVPYGRYIYTGELINIGDIIFIGNPNAKIVNIRTGVEIPIEQFGANFSPNRNSAITACVATDYTLTDTMDAPPLVHFHSNGNGFTINSNNKIKVGAGIGKVEIQAQVSFVGGVSQDGVKDLIVVSGGHARAIVSKGMTVAGNDKYIVCASTIVPVQENDQIFIRVGGAVGDSVAGQSNEYSADTYITVRALG